VDEDLVHEHGRPLAAELLRHLLAHLLEHRLRPAERVVVLEERPPEPLPEA